METKESFLRVRKRSYTGFNSRPKSWSEFQASLNSQLILNRSPSITSSEDQSDNGETLGKFFTINYCVSSVSNV